MNHTAEEPSADQDTSIVEAAQDGSDIEAEPTDLEELADWKPIAGVAVVPLLIVVLVIQGVLRAIHAPKWFDLVLVALFLSAPFAFFAFWARSQSALRLPGGRILRGEETTRFARFVWATGFASGAKGILNMALRAADAAAWAWQRLRFRR